MAGTFTHWMIVEEALDKFHKLPNRHPYFPVILENNHYVLLGATGPDYPYLGELINNYVKRHSWADRMHYENTGLFVSKGVANLVKLKERSFDVCLSWLSGFVTHLIADSVIHPTVNATVGPYLFNSDEHRHCEMVQDSFIFREVKGIELRYGAPDDEGYLGILKMCSDRQDPHRIDENIREFWSKTLVDSHPGAGDAVTSIDPDGWHSHFLSTINLAADPIAIFRHIGERKNLAYKKTTGITAEERRRFVDELKLPGGRTGKFREDAFDKAVEKVIEAWRRLFTEVQKGDSTSCNSYLRNWNLDTGVDDDEPYYWSNGG